jgi:hypothetical protein
MPATKKVDASKKDMNFFSEFTSSSTQVASALSIALVLFVLVFLVATVLFIVVLTKTGATKKEINKIKSEMSSDEYALALSGYEKSSSSMEGLRQYLYVLTSLQGRIEEMQFADTKYMDTITSLVPNSITLTQLKYVDGAILVSGNSDNYTAPLDMVAKLQDSGTFTFVSINDITQRDLLAEGLTAEEYASVKKYTFSFTGSLESSYSVSVTRFTNDAAGKPLSARDVKVYLVGENYGVSKVTSYSVDSVNYTLAKVMINDTAVTIDQLSKIIAADAISGRVSSTVDIKLYYDVVVEGGVAE